MFDHEIFENNIKEILSNLASHGGTPTLKDILPKERIAEENLELLIRYMSEEEKKRDVD